MQISTYSKALERGEEPIHERLFKLSRPQKELEAVAEEARSHDPITGQKLFQPAIGELSNHLAAQVKDSAERVEERLFKDAEERQKRMKEVL